MVMTSVPAAADSKPACIAGPPRPLPSCKTAAGCPLTLSWIQNCMSTDITAVQHSLCVYVLARYPSAEQAGGAVVTAQLPHAITVWLI